MSEPLPNSEIILYQTEDGRTRIQCRFENETLWLTQALISELFQVTVPTVNEHLKGIYAEGELAAGATIRKFRIVRSEGKREVAREIEHYNLDAILAVGFRVRSHRGTQFRQWAIGRLNEYLVKGFTMDDELVLETNLTDAGRCLVHGWYGSSNTASNSLPAVSQDSHWIPPGNGQTGWDAQPELYDGVVRPYCRGCHLSFPGLTWENSDMLEQMGYMVQYDVYSRQVMPHALRTWDKMWRSDDPHAPGVLLDELPGTGSWNATACPY